MSLSGGQCSKINISKLKEKARKRHKVSFYIYARCFDYRIKKIELSQNKQASENDYTSTFDNYELALEYVGILLRGYKELKKEKVKKIIFEKIDFELEEDSWKSEIKNIEILNELVLYFN